LTAAADDGLFRRRGFDRVLTAWQVEEALRMLSEEHRSALVEVHYKARSYNEVARASVCGRHDQEPRVLRAEAMRLALEELGWNRDD